jgi:hypothetical protein
MCAAIRRRLSVTYIFAVGAFANLNTEISLPYSDLANVRRVRMKTAIVAYAVLRRVLLGRAEVRIKYQPVAPM